MSSAVSDRQVWKGAGPESEGSVTFSPYSSILTTRGFTRNRVSASCEDKNIEL